MIVKPLILEEAEKVGWEIKVHEGKIQYTYNPVVCEDPQKILRGLQESKLDIIKYYEEEAKLYDNIVAVDIETAGLNGRTDDIRLISWASEKGNHVSTQVEDVASVLQDEHIKKVFHNAIFDVPFLIQKGYKVANYTDTLVMSRLLNPKENTHTLGNVVGRHLGIELDKALQKAENWQGVIQEQHLEYSKKDAEVTFKVANTMISKLKVQEKMRLLRQEDAALPCCIRCKVDGIPFNAQAWEKELKNQEVLKLQVEQEILKGLNTTINLNSPLQLKKTLNNRGIMVKSTKDEEIAKFEMQFPILTKIREYRKLNKLVTNAGKKLLEYVDSDGRIRANWQVNGTITGRMTCSSPNIQQVDHRVRPYFQATNGHVFIDCDYSQIELRVVAEIANDQEMIQAFINGEDLHIKTAKMIFGKTDISKEERQIAKTCNFGLIYGMSAQGLQSQLKKTCNLAISEGQAETFRVKFFMLYKGVRRWQEITKQKANISTLGGKTWSTKGLSYFEMFNYPVQGSAAEGLKCAMALLMDKIPDTWKVCAMIHDEILLEVPSEDEQLAKQLVETVMVQGMEKIIKRVPIVAEASSSKTWKKA